MSLCRKHSSDAAREGGFGERLACTALSGPVTLKNTKTHCLSSFLFLFFLQNCDPSLVFCKNSDLRNAFLNIL